VLLEYGLRPSYKCGIEFSRLVNLPRFSSTGALSAIATGMTGRNYRQRSEPLTLILFLPRRRFIQVDDLQAYLDKAESLGGKTVIPPTDVPGMGTFAWFADIDGNTIGLRKPTSDE